MAKLTCPLCGSEKLEKFEITGQDKITLGPNFNFQEIYHKCHSCDEEFDITGETDKNYLIAQKQAQKQFVKDTLDELNNNGIKMSFFERIFELPIRTLSRWKSGDFSNLTVVLLRIIKAYPGIIEAAENNFEKSFSQEKLNKNNMNEYSNYSNSITMIFIDEPANKNLEPTTNSWVN